MSRFVLRRALSNRSASRRLTALLSVALTVAACIAVAVALAPSASATTAGAGTYAAVTPLRVVNTATGAYRNHRGALSHGHSFTATIGGHGGVPKKAAAVVVTISAVSPTASGGLTAYAAGSTRPGVQNLLFTKGRNVAMTAIVRVSASGKITVYNTARSGTVHVTVDVSGYYLAGTPSTPGAVRTVAPKHVYSTTIGKRGYAAVPIGGHVGVPTSGVATVAVLITAASPAKAGVLTAFAAGHARAADPTVHFVPKVSITQFAIIPMGTKGRIAIYNSAASSVRVSVAVVAYSRSGIITAAGTTTARTEGRVLNGSKFAANATRTIAVGGHLGVPLRHVSAVIATISVTSSARGGNVVAWKGGTKRPGVTNLRFTAGQTASDYAVIPVSSKGTIAVRNSSGGTARLYVDINGYVQSNTITAPRTSVGRYVRTVGGAFADPSSAGDGCADATARSTLVLLELGAQRNDKKGVVLTATNTKVMYGALVAALNGYLHSFASCSPPAHAVVALGTNNEGSFSAYSATARGTDWANKVVDAVGTFSGVTVVGADDIEPDFASTRAQAQQWETAYLGATTASLIFNGSADGCSTTFGSPADCNYGWTLKQLYALAHNGNRISALPQVYTAGQAVQWANIDAAGGKAITFAGSLTEYAACPKTSSACAVASYHPADGWAALQHAIATVVASPSIPAATDLRVAQ